MTHYNTRHVIRLDSFSRLKTRLCGVSCASQLVIPPRGWKSTRQPLILVIFLMFLPASWTRQCYKNDQLDRCTLHSGRMTLSPSPVSRLNVTDSN